MPVNLCLGSMRSESVQPPATGSTLQPPHLFGPEIRYNAELFSETPSVFQPCDAYFGDYTTGFMLFSYIKIAETLYFFVIVAIVSPLLLSASVSPLSNF